MKRNLIILLLFICFFFVGCDRITSQVAQVPGLSDEIISFAENMEGNSDILNSEIVSEFIEAHLEGSGTEDDPYLIYESFDLYIIHAKADMLDKHYMMMNDISLPEVENGKSNWIPIGSANEPFTGSFNGNGHNISGMRIYTYENDESVYSITVGLFAYISGENACVRNLNISDAVIDIAAENFASINAGIISGYVSEKAKIKNCHIQGSISATNWKAKYIGGVVGNSSQAMIYNCSADVKITFITSQNIYEDVSRINDYFGGILGIGNSSTIEDSYTKVAISGISHLDNNRSYAGGIMGANRGGHISGCFSCGNILNSTNMGGIVGSNYHINFAVSTVENCFSIIEITGIEQDNENKSYLGGGIAGDNDGTITNCYALGKIDVNGASGGIAGTNTSGTVSGCIALQKFISGNGFSSKITGSAGILENNYGWSGIDVLQHGYIFSSDMDHKGSSNGEPVSISSLLDTNFFASLGWDISSGESIWTYIDIFSLPVLKGMTPNLLADIDISYFDPLNEKDYTKHITFKGSGTVTDPYLIFTLEDLEKIPTLPSFFLNRSFKLMNDINFSSLEDTLSNWTPIGNSVTPFQGTFDGNGKTISGIQIYDTNSDMIGFFGCLDYNSIVTDLDLIDMKIFYNPEILSFIGGIAGINLGTISNCSVFGIVNFTYSTVADTDVLKSSDNIEPFLEYWNLIAIVGGIVGGNVGHIENCYANCDIFITASGEFGGITGTNFGYIENCYSSGSIEHVFFAEEIHAFLTYVGGISGLNCFMISNCYSDNRLMSQGFVGGIVGYNFYEKPESLLSNVVTITRTITTNNGESMTLLEYVDLPEESLDNSVITTKILNCYSINELVAGSYATGGIAALNSGIIESCVSLPQMLFSSHLIGIIVGDNQYPGDLVNNYTSNRFNLDEIPYEKDSTTKRIQLSRLKQKSFYGSLGWDFSSSWEMKSGYAFPILRGVKGQKDLKTPDAYR